MRHHYDPAAHGSRPRFFSLIPCGGLFLFVLCSDFENGFEDAVLLLPTRVKAKLEPWVKLKGKGY